MSSDNNENKHDWEYLFRNYRGEDFINEGELFNRKKKNTSASREHYGRAANYGLSHLQGQIKKSTSSGKREIGYGRSGENYNEGDFGDETTLKENRKSPRQSGSTGKIKPKSKSRSN